MILPLRLCSEAINNVTHPPLAILPHSRLIRDLTDPRPIERINVWLHACYAAFRVRY
jgi:hypothetical protein